MSVKHNYTTRDDAFIQVLSNGRSTSLVGGYSNEYLEGLKYYVTHWLEEINQEIVHRNKEKEQKTDLSWRSMDSAPKDGRQFLFRYRNEPTLIHVLHWDKRGVFMQRSLYSAYPWWTLLQVEKGEWYPLQDPIEGQ